MNIRTKIQIASLLWLSTLGSISLAQTRASSAPAQVMVLDTYHFGNPDQDLHNMKPDNVLTPGKQAELAVVAARLARFKPTKIAVEAVSERADLRGEKKPRLHAQRVDERSGRALASSSA